MKIVILDTETSGSNKEDRVISLAFGEYFEGELINLRTGLFNPGVPIKQGAFWVHKISNEKVANKPSFKETEFFDILQTIFSSPENIVVGHAICNDLFMIAKEGLRCKCRLVDTQYCSEKVFQKLKTSLNFLVKEMNLLEDMNSDAVKLHTAEGDVIVTYQLFKELLKNKTLKELIDMSMAPFYELMLSVDGYRKQRIYHLATKNRESLIRQLNMIKDPKMFYAMMYFCGNVELFIKETKKAKILKILNSC